MSVEGTATVQCPACGIATVCELVQSINTRTDPDAKARLLVGELNVLACACGRRTQLASALLFHDPDRGYYARVVPDGDTAMAEAASLFRAVGATGTQRLVPSLNALVEKVKLLDAGLEDWAIEMAKVLLLASLGDPDLDRVLLFDRVDGPHLRWVLFDATGAPPEVAASAVAAYDKLVGRAASRPTSDEFQIDRAWAVSAVQAMIADGN